MQYLFAAWFNWLGSLIKRHWLIFVLYAFVVLPYVLRPGEFIAGNDASFFEVAAGDFFRRSLFFWRYLNGIGGEAFQGSTALPFTYVVSLVNRVVGPVVTQVLLKLVFYTLGYLGIYKLSERVSILCQETFRSGHATLVAFFYCINLLGFDLIRTWLNLYYVFYLLTPIVLATFLNALESGYRGRAALGFIAVCVLNLVVFANASYPAIQCLVLLIGAIYFLPKRLWPQAAALLAFFVFSNGIFLVENWLAVYYQRQSLFENAVNTKLINDAPLVQEKFYSMVYLLRFTSGRLLEGTRWTTTGSSPIFPQSAYYLHPFVQLVSFIPAFILFAHSAFQRERTFKQLFLCAWLLVGFLLVSMFGFSPLKDLWESVYALSPFLWIFRNSLKFSVVLMLAACLILYQAMAYRAYRYLFVVALTVLSWYGITGDFADRYSFTALPESYQTLQAIMPQLERGHGDKLMVFPAYGNLWLVYAFGYMGFHPLISLQNTIPLFTTNANTNGVIGNAIYTSLAELREVSPAALQERGIKYLFLNHDISPNAYYIEKDRYESDKRFLERHFTKLLENEQYTLFQVYDGVSEVVEGDGVRYQMINPTLYHVELPITSSTTVVLRQAFSHGWKMYPIFDGVVLPSISTNEAMGGKGLLMGWRTLPLLRHDAFWWTHEMNDQWENVWRLNKDEWLRTYGRLDAEGDSARFYLFFSPQRFFYYGWIATFVVYGAAVVVATVRRKSEY